MTVPQSVQELLSLLRETHLIPKEKLDELAATESTSVAEVIDYLVEGGVISRYQGEKTLTGKMRELLVGPYRLISPIGQGGMGTVFLADHISLSRRVALKIFPPERKNDRAALERFAREAKATAALDHPNIVKIHDIGQHDELNYLVMEFVDGQNLEQLINQRGQLSVSEAVGYVAQTASGLQHAFERGVVHRDIKPANLLLDHTGNIKILDMGLARFFTGEDDLTQRLDEGAILGTADFISPEQALDGKVDIRADIYSLGATFYTLLAGQPPFGGKSASQKLLAHQMRVATPIRQLRPDIPQEISDIVSKMMAKNPDDRFRTPAEVISALLPWIPEQVVVLGSNSGPLPRPAPKPQDARRSWLLTGIVMMVLVAGVTFGLFASPWLRGPRDPGGKETPTPSASGFVQKPWNQPLSFLLRNGEKPTATLPDSWSAGVQADSIAKMEVEVSEKGPIFRTRYQDGTQGAYWGLNLSLLMGYRYQLSFEYRTIGKSNALLRWLRVQGKPDDSELLDSQGEWQKVVFTRREERWPTTALEFVHSSTGEEGALEIRDVEVREVGPLTENYHVVQFSPDELPEGRAQVTTRTVVDGDHAFLKGAILATWNPTTIAEAKSTEYRGRKALGITTIQGTLAGMLFVKYPSLQQGCSYHLRLDYATQSKMEPLIKRSTSKEKARTIGRIAATSQEWKTFEYDWIAERSGEGWIEIQPVCKVPQWFYLGNVRISEKGFPSK